MEKFYKEKINIIFTVAVAASFFIGMHVGANDIRPIDTVTLANKEAPVAADFAPFWKVWNDINEKYPSATKVTDQERVYGAIAGLVGSLNDPYSIFFKPDEAKSFQEEVSGNFSGIGMEVGIKDKAITVIAPLKDTPAERAGIKPGDILLKIDGKSTAGMTIDDAIKLIRGEKGTEVTLSMFREGNKEPLEIKLVRDTINVPSIKTELRKDGVFVVSLYSFSSNSANDFRGAMKEFAASKSDKLILDLRGNPGGYLSAAVDIASWFLPTGKTVVTEDYGNNKEATVYRSKGYNIFSDKLKFVVLIDGGSASASEIVGGALQDYKKAKLVGTQSFGKGSVQEVVEVTPDTILKITVAKWLTPNGTSISAKGLTPDYEVKLTKEDVAAKRDAQMDKAVELLTK